MYFPANEIDLTGVYKILKGTDWEVRLSFRNPISEFPLDMSQFQGAGTLLRGNIRPQSLESVPHFQTSDGTLVLAWDGTRVLKMSIPNAASSAFLKGIVFTDDVLTIEAVNAAGRVARICKGKVAMDDEYAIEAT